MQYEIDNGTFHVVMESADIQANVGESAKIEVGQAINYIRSGQAEINAAVQSGITAFDNNAGDKTTAFNNNASSKTNDFNNNYNDKKEIIDGAVSDAQGYAATAKQWAIGEPSEPTGNSAKYWADEAAALIPTLAPVATTGSYNDLTDKPTIPTVNNGVLTIQKNGVDVRSFSANADSNVIANITVPTNTNELTNGAGFITGISSGDVTTALGYTPVNPSTLATVATSGSYSDLSDKPTIGSGILTIQKNGVDVKKFSANADSDTTANITVPTNTNELTNGAGFITGINSGDVTTALGFTPYDADNPDGFISGITSADVTTALGFTPADNNLSNVSTTAKVSSCGWAMPSNSKFDNLTVAASGNDYAMTSSGYLMVNGSSTSTSDTLVVVNNTTNMQVAARGGSGSYMRVFLPVQKGASVKLTYTSGVTINQLRFIYAVGSESEAS